MIEKLALKDLYQSRVLRDLEPLTPEQEEQLHRKARDELQKGTWPIGTLANRRLAARNLLGLRKSNLSIDEEERVSHMADTLWRLASLLLHNEHEKTFGSKASDDNDKLLAISTHLAEISKEFATLSLQGVAAIQHFLDPNHKTSNKHPSRVSFDVLLSSLRETVDKAAAAHRKLFIEGRESAPTGLHVRTFGDPNKALAVALRDILESTFPDELIETGLRGRFCRAFKAIYEIAKGSFAFDDSTATRYAKNALASQLRKRSLYRLEELRFRRKSIEDEQADPLDPSLTNIEDLAARSREFRTEILALERALPSDELALPRSVFE